MSRTVAAALLALLSCQATPCLAVDSYRYLHVTIETPWSIFLVLLVMMFVPFVLMAVLMWRQAHKGRSQAGNTVPTPPTDAPQ